MLLQTVAPCCLPACSQLQAGQGGAGLPTSPHASTPAAPAVKQPGRRTQPPAHPHPPHLVQVPRLPQRPHDGRRHRRRHRGRSAQELRRERAGRHLDLGARGALLPAPAGRTCRWMEGAGGGERCNQRAQPASVVMAVLLFHPAAAAPLPFRALEDGERVGGQLGLQAGGGSGRKGGGRHAAAASHTTARPVPPAEQQRRSRVATMNSSGQGVRGGSAAPSPSPGRAAPCAQRWWVGRCGPRAPQTPPGSPG